MPDPHVDQETSSGRHPAFPELVTLRWLFRMIPYVALLTLACSTALLLDCDLALTLLIGALFAASFVAMRRLVSRLLVRRSAALWDRFHVLSREHKRYSQLRAWLLRFVKGADVDLIISNSPHVNATTHVAAGRVFVELPLGLIKRYANDEPALETVLAHEAGHIVHRDYDYVEILSGIVATIFAALGGLVVYALWVGGWLPADDPSVAPFLLLVPTCIGPFFLAWTALVVGSEIEADAYASEWVGAARLDGLLHSQLKGRDASHGTFNLVRFLAHPDLSKRARVRHAGTPLGTHSMLLTNLALGSTLGLFQTAAAAAAELLRVPPLCGVAAAWFFGIGAIYRVFFFQAVRRHGSTAETLARSFGGVLWFALCYAVTVTVSHGLRYRGEFFPERSIAGVAVTIALPPMVGAAIWACCNVALLMAKPNPRLMPALAAASLILVGTVVGTKVFSEAVERSLVLLPSSIRGWLLSLPGHSLGATWLLFPFLIILGFGFTAHVLNDSRLRAFDQRPQGNIR